MNASALGALDANALIAIASGESPYLRIPMFFEPPDAVRFLERLRGQLLQTQHPGFAHVAHGIGYLGIRYTGGLSAEQRTSYFESAVQIPERLRTAAAPTVSPLDRFLAHCSSVWPGGCEVARLEEHSMSPCVVRMVEDGGTIEPHQDGIPQGFAQHADLTRPPSILAVNLFLQVAGSGGELEVWRESYDPDAYRAHQVPGSYALDRERLPPVREVVIPRTGDLFLINASRAHAVRAVRGGTRCTLSFFVALVDAETPLVLWA